MIKEITKEDAIFFKNYSKVVKYNKNRTDKNIELINDIVLCTKDKHINEMMDIMEYAILEKDYTKKYLDLYKSKYDNIILYFKLKGELSLNTVEKIKHKI
jgi:hypothetical protein